MAITATLTYNKNHVNGDQRVMDFSISLSGTYVTGGFTITPASVGLDVIDFVIPVPDPSAGAGTAVAYVYAWNSSTGKMQLFVTPSSPDGTLAMVELTSTTTVTTAGVRCLIYGVD